LKEGDQSERPERQPPERLHFVQLFTDGACSGNPGPGGWAFILRHPQTGRELEQAGGAPETTNNRMELQAVIEGLATLKRRADVEIVTDSEYVAKGCREWLAGWKRRGWQTADKKPVKNVELWTRLDELLQRHVVRFTVVRGHQGHPENKRCDELAVLESKRFSTLGSRSSGED
jgi:ribonuclease HI